MAEYSLTASSPLNGYAKKFGGIGLREQVDIGIMSIAVADGSRHQFDSQVRDTLGMPLPETGHSSATGHANTRLLGLQSNQYFYIFGPEQRDSVSDVSHRLGPLGYYTDQSDSWAVLHMTGSECRRTLARMCMIDLEQSSFPPGSVARTTIEHLAVIIIADTADSYVLLTPRSSAASFLHALESAV